MTVEYNDNNLLVLSDNYYEYLGGAHGNNFIHYYNIDLKSKKLLKLSDILLNTQGLAQEIYNKLEEQGKAKVLFVTAQTIYLPDNFYISGSRLYFVYNPYEIAPFSEGQISVEFTFKELGNRLNPKFLKEHFPNFYHLAR
jgi:hypothetical protein